MEYFKDDESFGEVKEVKSIFEMDCHPDLDIYGDFEYDLDEEDYIGTTAKQSLLQRRKQKRRSQK